MAPLPNPVTGVTSGYQSGAAAPSGLTSNAAGTTPAAVSLDSGKPTYTASGVGLTFYSTAAAVLVEIQGSATRTIRVRRIEIWGQAGTKFFTELSLLRSTTLAATGTPVAASMNPLDTGSAAASAVVNSYAAAATFGTGHLLLSSRVLNVSVPSATMGPTSAVWDYLGSQALILRGTADVAQIYNNITGLGTATFGFSVLWEEDLS